MAASVVSRHLLILGCSGRKRHDVDLLPALDRYDGVNYRVLRRARRDTRWHERLDVLIISAEYGLLAAQDMIPYYDRLMTPKRAEELRPSVGVQLDHHLAQHAYTDILINLGKMYLLAIQGSSRLRSSSNVVYTAGRIGQKMGQMKRWLYAIE